MCSFAAVLFRASIAFNRSLISFATDDRNLGCVVMDSDSPEGALTKATSLGLNPGGQAAIWSIPEWEAGNLGRNRLISPDEMASRNYQKAGALEDAGRAIPAPQSTVCPTCNGEPNFPA